MGHLQIVKLLVEAGADVNSRGENGSSALMASARNCHWNVFDYLAPYTSQQIQDDVANLAKWLAENNIKK